MSKNSDANSVSLSNSAFTIRRSTNFTSELNEIVFFLDLWEFAVQFVRSAVNIKTAGIDKAMRHRLNYFE